MPSPASSPWIRRSPQRSVLPGQPQHHRPHLAMRCRAPGAAPARQPRPPAADDVALPAQDRAGSDDQPHRRQPLRRYRPRKQRQPRPVRPRQPRMSARPLTLSHRELMAQHKDLGVLPPRLPPRQAQQRHGTGDNQEDQLQACKPASLQACKPKIIPRPGRPRPAWHVPDARPSSQRSAEHPARWHRFSAPTGPSTVPLNDLAPRFAPHGTRRQLVDDSVRRTKFLVNRLRPRSCAQPGRDPPPDSRPPYWL